MEHMIGANIFFLDNICFFHDSLTKLAVIFMLNLGHLYNSVAYVSRSGGMSNELNNIVCLNSDGVYEGVAIGGDR